MTPPEETKPNWLLGDVSEEELEAYNKSLEDAQDAIDKEQFKPGRQNVYLSSFGLGKDSRDGSYRVMLDIMGADEGVNDKSRTRQFFRIQFAGNEEYNQYLLRFMKSLGIKGFKIEDLPQIFESMRNRVFLANITIRDASGKTYTNVIPIQWVEGSEDSKKNAPF